MKLSLYQRISNSIKFRLNYRFKKIEAKNIKRKQSSHFKEISKINNNNFTIISQNCWGGSVYEDLNIPYQTPTVGLFFYAPCFIELLKNLKENINKPLQFVNESKYKEANKYRNENYAYPIGKLGDRIEIQFLHYRTEQEALEKWNRRKERINWDNIFVASSDRDRMTVNLMFEFDKLPIKNKVLFTAQKNNIKSCAYLKDYRHSNQIGDIYNQKYYVSRSFFLANWLNK